MGRGRLGAFVGHGAGLRWQVVVGGPVSLKVEREVPHSCPGHAGQPALGDWEAGAAESKNNHPEKSSCPTDGTLGAKFARDGPNLM